MQAIQTKYIGPTNTRQSRIKASAQAGSITVNWNYDLDENENHRAAAAAFIRKMKWDQAPSYVGFVSGGLKNVDVHVMIHREEAMVMYSEAQGKEAVRRARRFIED